MRLKDRVAIVTGAGSGIGRATAVRFAQEGAKVIVADVDAQGGRETERLIRQVGGEATFVQTDVRQVADTEKMARVALGEYGGAIDILVNGAGVLRDAYVIDLSEEDWDLTIDVNLKGTFLCCKAVLPTMLKQKRGTIVNVSSSGALYWPRLYPAYVASKMGVLGLTQSLAREVREHNISVMAIRPVYVDTPMGRRAFHDQEGRMPQGDDFNRMLTPEQIAGVILNMVDPEMMPATTTIVDTLA